MSVYDYLANYVFYVRLIMQMIQMFVYELWLLCKSWFMYSIWIMLRIMCMNFATHFVFELLSEL